MAVYVSYKCKYKTQLTGDPGGPGFPIIPGSPLKPWKTEIWINVLTSQDHWEKLVTQISATTYTDVGYFITMILDPKLRHLCQTRKAFLQLIPCPPPRPPFQTAEYYINRGIFFVKYCRRRFLILNTHELPTNVRLHFRCSKK